MWASDVVMDRTHDGRPLKMLTVVDEYPRECVAIAVRRRMKSTDVQEVLGELFLTHGCPVHLRSDNGPEFIAQLLRQWIAQLAIAPLFIEPGSPWENGSIESFNGKFRDELLNRELFSTLSEHRSSLNVGGTGIIRSGLTVPWATGHQLQRRLSPARCMQD